jgi:type VI secretion system protein VasD
MLALALLGGCKTKPPPPPPPPPPPKPVVVHVSFIASNQLNPDGSNRPSPLVVRVFQLHTAAEFTDAEYSPLYDQEKQVLGPGWLAREQAFLHPGETQQLDLQINPDTRFIGVLAAFRDLRQWHALVAVPTKDGIPAPKKGLVTIHLDKNAVTIDPIE